MRILATLFLIFTIAFGPHAANAIEEYCEYNTEEQCNTHPECYWYNEGNGKAPYCEINCNQYSWEELYNKNPNAKEQCEALGMCTYKQYEYSGQCSFMTESELKLFCQSKATKEDCQENKACYWNWRQETCDSNTTDNQTIYGNECNTNDTGFFLNKTKSKCITCNTQERYGYTNNKCELCDKPNQVINNYNCVTCYEGSFPYNDQCLTCRFGTPNENQTGCVCWVNMYASSDYYKLCNPDNGYIEYAIVFNNNPKISDDDPDISNDKTDVVEVEYRPTYKCVKNYPDRDDNGCIDEVKIYTNGIAGQKPTANGYLFKGWRDAKNPEIIIEGTLTAEVAHTILNPSKMTEDDKVEYLTEDGEPWPQYGKELTAIWEKCPAGYYCLPGEDKPTPCPAGTTSELNSATKNDCYIKGGESRICNHNGSKCFTIPTKEKYYIKKQ